MTEQEVIDSILARIQEHLANTEGINARAQALGLPPSVELRSQSGQIEAVRQFMSGLGSDVPALDKLAFSLRANELNPSALGWDESLSAMRAVIQKVTSDADLGPDYAWHVYEAEMQRRHYPELG